MLSVATNHAHCLMIVTAPCIVFDATNVDPSVVLSVCLSVRLLNWSDILQARRLKVGK